MLRIFYSLILSFLLFSIAFISYGFGDVECTLNTWLGSFLLPIWSVGIISLWHDLGRYAYENFFDSKESKLITNLKMVSFLVWMGFILTYVVYVHIQLFATPLILVIPFLMMGLKELMVHDWSKIPSFKRSHVLTVVTWLVASYPVYWLLTIAWILVRVWFIDNLDVGTVYYIQ
jgi:hypothetical protein